jgi:hypothetical protein
LAVLAAVGWDIRVMIAQPNSGPGQGRWRCLLAVALIVAGGAILAGCSATTIADHMPTAVGGLPEGAPERPVEGPAYPAVHDRPQDRSQAVLTAEQQKQLEDELIAARDRRGNSGAAAKPAAGSTRNP